MLHLFDTRGLLATRLETGFACGCVSRAACRRSCRFLASSFLALQRDRVSRGSRQAIHENGCLASNKEMETLLNSQCPV